MPFKSLARLSSWWAFTFLTLSLHAWTASLYSPPSPCPRSTDPASTSFMFPFCVWILPGAPCSSLQASCPLCLTSCMSGWTDLEIKEGDPGESNSCPGLLFCPGSWSSSKQIPEKAEACSPEVQGCSSGICLVHSVFSLNKVFSSDICVYWWHKASTFIAFWNSSGYAIILFF